MKRKKICVITGMRSDYGHLYWILKAIQKQRGLQLQIVATGAHLSKKFGLTHKDITSDGFKIDKKVHILKYDNTETGITKSIGEGCKGFADAFDQLKPDMVLILGDRFEMLAASIAAYIAKIPIAHIHGGETSQGAIDEGIRHSITKMARIHFAATKEYCRRIVQLGEQPRDVFHFGAPGLDAIYRAPLLSKDELENALKFDFNGRIALVTYHPVTLEKISPEIQVKNMLKAIEKSGVKVIFTQSNADAYGGKINRMIQIFCKKNATKYKFIKNLGQKRYLSCLKYCSLMVGNSSSGLIEAPSFKLPVVNIGNRQKGRINAKNIINVSYHSASITKGIAKALTGEFKKDLKGMRNPYVKFRNGTASQRIVKKLYSLNGESSVMKKFYDLQLN